MHALHPLAICSEATGRGLQRDSTRRAHAEPMQEDGKRAAATLGACTPPQRGPGSRWDHRHSRSGTSSTQGDRGVNDSFRHLYPSGDSTGGKSARMICVGSRRTDKGKRKRENMKRAADPDAETQRDVATRLPSHQKLVHSHWRCGLVRCTPAWPRTSFPSPFPSRDVTSCRQWNVDRSTGCHSAWCL